MNRFYNLPTEKYAPLSHDNTYLFNHYERINNFLKQRISPRFRNILAKPVKQTYSIDWFSMYGDLRESNDLGQTDALRAYWEFKDELKKIIEQIPTGDSNNRNWIELLEKVFRPEDNLIFTNGKDLSVIWGWQFENNAISRPELAVEERRVLDPPPGGEDPDGLVIDGGSTSATEEPKLGEPDEETTVDIPEPDPVIDEPLPQEDLWVTTEEEVTPEAGKGFLEFLKEFAAKYAWLLLLLLALIALVFLYKSFTYNTL